MVDDKATTSGTADQCMRESSQPDATQQLIREMRRRVRDLEEQNASLRRYLVLLRDDLMSEDFTLDGDQPR